MWLGCLFIYSIKSDSGCMYACVNMGDEVCSSLLQPDAVLARLSMFIQLLPPSPFQEDNPGFDITVVVQTFLPDSSVTDSLKRIQENYVCYFLSSFYRFAYDFGMCVTVMS